MSRNVRNLKKRTLKQNETAYYTVCPRSNYPFYIVRYYENWVTTSLTYSIIEERIRRGLVMSVYRGKGGMKGGKGRRI